MNLATAQILKDLVTEYYDLIKLIDTHTIMPRLHRLDTFCRQIYHTHSTAIHRECESLAVLTDTYLKVSFQKVQGGFQEYMPRSSHPLHFRLLG